MQPKLLKPRKISTEIGDFDAETWSGKNESGYRAMFDRVLVLPDQASTHIGSLVLPDDVRDRANAASITGVIVDIGPDAFVWNSDRTRRTEGKRPEVGTRIYFERYSGQIVQGIDGRIYRGMDDKCIGFEEIPMEEPIKK